MRVAPANQLSMGRITTKYFYDSLENKEALLDFERFLMMVKNCPFFFADTIIKRKAYVSISHGTPELFFNLNFQT